MNDKNTQFWYFLIEGKLDNETEVFGNFYSYGERCGDALGKAYLAAEKEGIKQARLIETTRLDMHNDFDKPEEAEQITESCYMIRPLTTFKVSSDEFYFNPPDGIAFDTTQEEFEPDLIKEGFITFHSQESGIYELQMVVDKGRMSETFYQCINFMNEVNALCIYLCDHWQEQERELWVNDSLRDKEKVIEFIKKHHTNTLDNGFVDLLVNSSHAKTNLILCEHKKIQLHTESEEIFKSFIDSIHQLGFEQLEEFYNIEHGYHHWHYRPTNSLDRKGFKTMLTNEGFEEVKLKQPND